MEKARILREDIVKQVFKRPVVDGMPISTIAQNLNLSSSKVSNTVQKLSRSRLLTTQNSTVILSDDGVLMAEKLVRAHRLWETYQVTQMGLNSDQIHEEAERLEHFLSEELVDEIEKELGYPATDPHNSPIPSKK